MEKKLNVLLTGASGAIGHEVLKQLNASKTFNITVFDVKTYRSKKAFSDFKKEIKIIYGDISKKQDVEKACIEQDIVIHLAAIIPPLADEHVELSNKVNVLGTENLIRALEQFSPNTFLFYSSSISIYGDRVVNPDIRLTDPLKPSEGDEYAITKLATEELIKNSKLDWSIFRLCAIMGKHKISKLMFHQPLNTSFEIATLQDTARAFVNAIPKREELIGKTFNLGGGENCRTSYEEFLKRSFKIVGLGKFNFAPKSFAERNFHCGFYQDGDDLENILHFRKDTLDTYFEKERKKFAGFKRSNILIFRGPVKFYLQRMSEPLKAIENNDVVLVQRFFGSDDCDSEEDK